MDLSHSADNWSEQLLSIVPKQSACRAIAHSAGKHIPWFQA